MGALGTVFAGALAGGASEYKDILKSQQLAKREDAKMQALFEREKSLAKLGGSINRQNMEYQAQLKNDYTVGAFTPKGEGILNKDKAAYKGPTLTPDEHTLSLIGKGEDVKRKEARKTIEHQRNMRAIDAATAKGLTDPEDRKSFITLYLTKEAEASLNTPISEDAKTEAMKLADTALSDLKMDKDKYQDQLDTIKVEQKLTSDAEAETFLFGSLYQRYLPKTSKISMKDWKSPSQIKAEKKVQNVINSFKGVTNKEELDKIYQVQLSKFKSKEGKKLVTDIYQMKLNRLPKSINTSTKVAPTSFKSQIWSDGVLKGMTRTY